MDQNDTPWYNSYMQISIPFKAYSINDYYYNNRKFGKRKEAKQWEWSINWALVQYEAEFASLRSSFNPQIHGLSVEMVFFYKDFYTKAGKINSKIYDLSNCEKVLLDLLVNPSVHGKAPYASPNLNIDDKYVIALSSKKRPSDKDSIMININIVSLPEMAISQNL